MAKCRPAVVTLGLFGLSLLASPSPGIADPHKQIFPPLAFRKVTQYPTCPGAPKAEQARAIDFSQPADDALLDRAWRSGVRVIFRYYDWADSPHKLANQCQLGGRTGFNRQFVLPWKPGPTFAGKTLTADERDRIHAKGFSIGIVFQHCHAQTFKDNKRAAFDANRVLDLAHKLSQPKGTTIFFGVDFNTVGKEIKNIQGYFKTLNRILKPRGYEIGVYGNGYVCTALKEDGLASYCWLSQSTGFEGSKAYHAKGEWDIKQCATRKPFDRSNVEFDLDILNTKKSGPKFWRPM